MLIGMDARVIGVVADVHESSVEGKPGWQMYLSGASPQFGPEGAQLVVRTRLPPETLASSVMKYTAANQSGTAGDGIPADPAAGESCGVATPFLRFIGGHFCRARIVIGFRWAFMA